ncbi:hypothetical protein D3C71_25970 [compost metagenome]
MGGNALKNTTTRRLNRPEFEATAKEVVRVLRECFPGTRVDTIPAYRAKADFGDLDVLMETEGLNAGGGGEQLQALARERFYATDKYKNGNVLSFDYRATREQTEPGFQVDVIHMAATSYDFALGYFSYNDLGNLIGRTAHKAGFSFGHDGLWYVFRDGDYRFRDLLLTDQFDSALEFLGYDPRVHAQGFDTLESIFQYVAGSKYFNRDIFLLENRNNVSRTRDRKRKTYTEFLKWCDANPQLPAFSYPEDKTVWLPAAFERYPQFRTAHAQAVEDLAKSRALKERFNGGLVAGISGLEGKQLGELMRRLRESFSDSEAMYQFFLTASEDQVTEYVQNEQAKMAQAAAATDTAT